MRPTRRWSCSGGYGITGWYGHRNAYLFHDAGEDGLQTTVLGTHLSGHLARFYDTRELYGEEGLAPHLRRYVEARDPRRMAINQSRTISMADGLTAELKEYLLDAVGPRYRDRSTGTGSSRRSRCSSSTSRRAPRPRTPSSGRRPRRPSPSCGARFRTRSSRRAGPPCSTSTTGSPPSGSGRASSSTSRRPSTCSAPAPSPSTTATTR